MPYFASSGRKPPASPSNVVREVAKRSPKGFVELDVEEAGVEADAVDVSSAKAPVTPRTIVAAKNAVCAGTFARFKRTFAIRTATPNELAESRASRALSTGYLYGACASLGKFNDGYNLR